MNKIWKFIITTSLVGIVSCFFYPQINKVQKTAELASEVTINTSNSSLSMKDRLGEYYANSTIDSTIQTYELNVPNKPEVLEEDITFDATTISVNTKEGNEYRLIFGEETFYDWQDGTGAWYTFINLHVNCEYILEVRVKKTEQSEASEVTQVLVKTDKNPGPSKPVLAATDIMCSYTSIVIKTKVGCEYRVLFEETIISDWQDGTGNNIRISNLMELTTYIVEVRVKGTDTTYPSESFFASVTTLVSVKPDAPQTPTEDIIVNVGTDFITIKSNFLNEYRLSTKDGNVVKNWSSSGSDITYTFYDLDLATVYVLTIRVAATSSTDASDSSEGFEIMTKKNNATAKPENVQDSIKNILPTSFTVNTKVNYEYSIDGGLNWVSGTGRDYTFNRLESNQEYILSVRIMETSSTYASEFVNYTVKTSITSNSNNYIWYIVEGILAVLIALVIVLGLLKKKKSNKNVVVKSFTAPILLYLIAVHISIVIVEVVILLALIFYFFIYKRNSKIKEKTQENDSKLIEGSKPMHEDIAPSKSLPKTEIIPINVTSETEEIEEAEDKEYDLDSEEETSNIIYQNGRAILVRYKKSYKARVILSSNDLKTYYTEIKNYILSYNVKNRISWSYESFNFGRKQVCKLNVRGKSLVIYLALNPKDYEDTKYNIHDASDSKKYALVPVFLKVKSSRGLKYAKELVDTVMKAYGVVQGEIPNINYYEPTQSIEELIGAGLVKELLSEKELETLKELNKRNLDSNVTKFVSASEVKNIALHKELLEESFVKKALKEQGQKTIINVDTISRNYIENEIVSLKTLKEKGLISKKAGYVKCLARGVLDKKLIFSLQDYSDDAIKMILLTGGTFK